jgi:ABC-2 type transport system permease protein
VVLPAVMFVIITGVQALLLLVSAAVVAAHGVAARPLVTELPVLQMSLQLLYGLVVLALWHAPIYGWLLLVSGWARRAPFLWAVLPPLAICVVERIGFGTWHVADVLKQRLNDGFSQAFGVRGAGNDPLLWLPTMEPLRFVTSPGLWLGLAAAAVFFAAAIRQRRYRDPV